MKKIIISVILAATATNINAQLVVDFLGRVGIRTETPKSMLSVGADGNNYTGVYINADENENGLFLRNYSDTYSGLCGGQFSVKNNLASGCGGRGVALGSNDMNSVQNAIGMAGYADKSYNSIGILGAKWLPDYFNR